MNDAVQGYPWLWVPIVITAAFAQTVRNTAQRHLISEAGMLGATLSRFLFGLPIVAAIVGVSVLHGSLPVPLFDRYYAGWLALGAAAQIGATAFLLLAIQERNFLLGITYSKTEVLQAAAFSAVFLHEFPTPTSTAAIVLATLGVGLLSLSRDRKVLFDSPRTLAYGLSCGACFALASVCFRAASLSLGAGVTPWVSGAWNLLWAQLGQSLLIGAYLIYFQPATLLALARASRSSMTSGSMGAAASFAWFTAYGMRSAADVRALGLIEIIFGLFVSQRLMSERLHGAEWVGLVFICTGMLVICLSV